MTNHHLHESEGGGLTFHPFGHMSTCKPASCGQSTGALQRHVSLKVFWVFCIPSSVRASCLGQRVQPAAAAAEFNSELFKSTVSTAEPIMFLVVTAQKYLRKARGIYSACIDEYCTRSYNLAVLQLLAASAP